MDKEEFMLALKKIMNRIATDEDKLVEISPITDELINHYLEMGQHAGYENGYQDAQYDRLGT